MARLPQAHYTARMTMPTCRNQLVNGFQLVKIWATNYFTPQSNAPVDRSNIWPNQISPRSMRSPGWPAKSGWAGATISVRKRPL